MNLKQLRELAYACPAEACPGFGREDCIALLDLVELQGVVLDELHYARTAKSEYMYRKAVAAYEAFDKENQK